MSFISTYSAASIRAWQSTTNEFVFNSQIIAPNTTANSFYSRDSLVISGDGNYIAMGSGALNREVGVYNGSLFPIQANLTPNYAGNDSLGAPIAINYNGNTIAAADQLNGNVIIFTGSGNTWTQSQILSGFGGGQPQERGLSLDGSGDYLAAQSNGNPQVYYRSNGTYSLQQSITGVNSTGNPATLVLNNNGDYLTYSNIGESSSSGAVYVYNRSGNTWSLQQKITANNAASGDAFGYSTDINNSGNILVTTTPFKSPSGKAGVGQVYIFTRSGNTWSQYANISGPIPTGVTGINFGYSVAINGIGDTIYIGASSDDGSSGNVLNNQGSAFVYGNINGNWTQLQKINAPITTGQLFFGGDIGINDQGTTLIVGAEGYDIPNTDVGTGYVFSNL